VKVDGNNQTAGDNPHGKIKLCNDAGGDACNQKHDPIGTGDKSKYALLDTHTTCLSAF
jgi:hypothetical protein